MRNKISEVQIVPIKPQDGLVGFASFVFDDSFYFRSVGIYTRPNGGYRLTYPTRKIASEYCHLFHPIKKQISDAIEQAVITQFEALQS